MNFLLYINLTKHWFLKMGLTIIFRNLRGNVKVNHKYIREIVSRYYTRYYILQDEHLKTWYLYSSKTGDHVTTWPHLPHTRNFFISSFNAFDIYIDYISINSNANIDSSYTDIDEPIQTKLEYYINKCAYHLQSMHESMNNPRNSTCFYVVTMLYLLKYYCSIGVEINEEHRSMILHTLAQEADSIFLFDYIYEMFTYEFTESWFSCEYTLTGEAKNRMIMESILKSYDATSGEKVYLLFKGMYMAKFILSLENMLDTKGINKEYVGQIIADFIRLKYATIQQSKMLVKVFTNGWQDIDNETTLARSIRAFDNLAKSYVNELVLSVLNIEQNTYDTIMDTLTDITEVMTPLTVKRALCVNNFGTMVSTYSRVLTFSNVTFDLNLMKIREHYPHDLSEHSIPYNFDMFINRQRQMMLDKFMSDLFDDSDIIHYMYTIFGRALRGNVLDKAFWVFIGASNAGKSRFTEMVAKAFGQYSATLSADIFNTQNRNSSSATPDLNMMIGRLVGFVQEPRRGRVDIEAIKERTGDERLYVRELYQSGTNIKNTIKLFMTLNHIQFNSSDAALWNRIRVVYFNRVFVSQEEYERLAVTMDSEKLHREYRIGSYDIDRIIEFIAPEFMTRCIAQYYHTLEMPLIDPPIIKEYNKKFRLDNDNIFLFVNTVYEVTNEHEDTVSLQYAYERYKDWFDERTADTRNLLTLPMFRDGVRSSGLGVDEDVILGLKDKVDTKLLTASLPYFRNRTIEMGNPLSKDFDIDSIIKLSES